MSAVSALIFMAQVSATAAPACYALGDQPILVSRSDREEFSTSKIQRKLCPEGFEWTAEAAVSLCTFYAHYDLVQQYYFVELYGVTTKEVCNEGRIAAGLSALDRTSKE